MNTKSIEMFLNCADRDANYFDAMVHWAGENLNETDVEMHETETIPNETEAHPNQSEAYLNQSEVSVNETDMVLNKFERLIWRIEFPYMVVFVLFMM